MSLSGPGVEGAAAAFGRLAVELRSTQGLDETVETVVEFALHALSCSFAGLVLRGPGLCPEVTAVSDRVVADIYDLQIVADNGPLIDALREERTVVVSNVATDTRWPVWAEKVDALGVRSVLDVPLSLGPFYSGTVGVLGLYSAQPHAFTEDDEAVAHILAQHASVAVATARQEASLAQAIDARRLIGQATGILMERFDIDADRAFAVLRRYSQDTNTKLRDVAQQLIDTRRLPRDTPDS